MEVAVIIPVTRPDHLSLCLGNLIRQTYDHTKIEVMLIKEKELELNIPITDIKIKQFIEDKLHTGLRRNIAIKNTGAEILAFLDDDAIPPLDWIANAVRYLSNNNVAGVCGPIVQFQENLSFLNRLAGAANDSIFLEGFDDSKIYEKKSLKFYNIPLCNSVILRKAWEGVKGFNETAYYYMDDIEFFFLANKLGYKFDSNYSLTINHAVESFPFKFLKKKFITRFHVGINAIIFNDIYGKIPFINLAFLAYPILILLCYLGIIHKSFIFSVFLIYIISALFFSIPYFSKSKIVFIFLPMVFLFTHLTNFIAFTAGLVYYFLNSHKFSGICRDKEERLKTCRLSAI